MKAKEGIILIVDDDPDMCWALEHILTKDGFCVKKALSGQEALALMAKYSFEQALLDAKLPDMEGLELARRIHEIDPSIRIVIVSGYYYKNDIVVHEAIEAGLIFGFIGKPFQNDEILRTIDMARSL